MRSEILPPLLCCHQQFLLEDLRGRWSFSMKGEHEVSDDLINDFMILNKGDNRHPGKKRGLAHFSVRKIVPVPLFLAQNGIKLQPPQYLSP